MEHGQGHYEQVETKKPHSDFLFKEENVPINYSLMRSSTECLGIILIICLVRKQNSLLDREHNTVVKQVGGSI